MLKNLFLYCREEFEDSDGISVISESEMIKNNLNHQSDDEKPIVEEIDEPSSEKNENEKEPELLTPPATPSFENSEEKNEEVTSKELELQQEILTRDTQSHGAVFLVVMALIIAFLYTNISTLKKEIATTASIYERRISTLEDENQQLKNQLNELFKQLKLKEEILIPSSDNVDKVLLEKKFIERQEEANQQPITKNVWMGGEKEDVVEVLDKKLNSLPDYCYFTDKTDLFYDYNKEICEGKKRKLEDRVKQFHMKNGQNIDNSQIYDTPRDKNYDDFMKKMRKQLLASLNEIKNSRVSNSITDNEKIQTSDKKKQKRMNNEKQENIKKRKEHHGKEKSGGECNDRRTVGREEARKRHENKENWFLKRKNEREIHRLEKNLSR